MLTRLSRRKVVVAPNQLLPKLSMARDRLHRISTPSVRLSPSTRERLSSLEDHHESRDVIEDRDQLRPDIETFEQLTGEVIHPQDEVPGRGDEVEREDFDQSR